MSKIAYVLLGVALTAGALSLGSYRLINKSPRERAAPQTSQQLPTSRSIQSPQQRTPSSQPAPSSNRSSGSSSEISTAQMIDWGLNAANIFVGIMGIWITMRAMRRNA